MSIWPTSQGETACCTSNQCVCQVQSQEVMRPDCAAPVTPPSQQAAEHTSGQLICWGLRTDTCCPSCWLQMGISFMSSTPKGASEPSCTHAQRQVKHCYKHLHICVQA